MIQNKIFSQEDAQTKASGHWPTFAIDLLSNLSPQPLYKCLRVLTYYLVHMCPAYDYFLLLLPLIIKRTRNLFGLLPLALILPQCGGKGCSGLVQISCRGSSHVYCTEHSPHHSSSTVTLSTATSVFFWFCLLLLNISLAIKCILPDYKYLPVTISIGFLTIFFLLAACCRGGSCRFLNDHYIAINCHSTEMFIQF